jgi:hypothetical protein
MAQEQIVSQIRIPAGTSGLVGFAVKILVWLDLALWMILGPVIRRAVEIVYFCWYRLILSREYSPGDVKKTSETIWFMTGLVVIVIVLLYH